MGGEAGDASGQARRWRDADACRCTAEWMPFPPPSRPFPIRVPQPYPSSTPSTAHSAAGPSGRGRGAQGRTRGGWGGGGGGGEGLFAARSPGAGPPLSGGRGQEERWTVKVYARRAAPGAAGGLASPDLAERRVLLARGSRRCRVDRVGHGVEPAQARARGHEGHRERPRVRCMRWVVQLTRRSRRGPHPLCARGTLRRYSSCKVPIVCQSTREMQGSATAVAPLLCPHESTECGE